VAIENSLGVHMSQSLDTGRSSQNPLPDWAKEIGLSQEVLETLGRVVEPDSLQEWFGTPNDTLDGLTPAQVCRAGDLESIRRMAEVLNSGEQSS
jgi:hypothetical protein